MKLDYVAKLTIHDADKLADSPMDRRYLVLWLRKLAKDLGGSAGLNLSKRYTARLMK